MADKPLFNLDAKGRWRLAYDRQQWVVQRRAQKPRVRRLEGHAIADTGWRGVSFVGSKKTTLGRIFSEEGNNLTAEAQTRFDALPDQFLTFLAEIDSPAPDNARTAAIHPSDGPERQSGQEGLSTGVLSARAPKAA